jgi:hypothetical protein
MPPTPLELEELTAELTAVVTPLETAVVVVVPGPVFPTGLGHATGGASPSTFRSTTS